MKTVETNYQITALNMPQQPAQYKRRVGTFTLGICLILIGILVPVALFWGDGWWEVLLFSPFILTILGAEILYYSYRYKEEKYKYDGLSIFIVLIITFGTLFCSGAVKVAKSASKYHNELEESRIAAISTIQKAVDESNCKAVVNVNNTTSFQDVVAATIDNGKLDSKVTAYIEFSAINNSTTPDKEQIINAFANVAAACSDLNIEYLTLQFLNNDKEYIIRLYDGMFPGINANIIRNGISINSISESEPTDIRETIINGSEY